MPDGDPERSAPSTHADQPTSEEKREGKAGQPPEPEARVHSAAFLSAKARHARNSAFLLAFITKGKAETRTPDGAVWPNTCEWLLIGKTPLRALTETHDSPRRAAAHKSPELRAVFGVQDTLTHPTDYAEHDLEDLRNVGLLAKEVNGMRNEELGVLVVEPQWYAREGLQEVLVHEVRHAADHHVRFPRTQYPSEFNAYWHSPRFAKYTGRSGTADDSLTTVTGVKLDGFDNLRQQQIFKFMFDQVDSVMHEYWYTRYYWDLPDPEMVSLYRTYARPAGVNLINSPRIDDVYLQLHATTIDFEALRSAVGRLEKSDITELEGLGMRKDWRGLLDSKLPAEQAREIRHAMGL